MILVGISFKVYRIGSMVEKLIYFPICSDSPPCCPANTFCIIEHFFCIWRFRCFSWIEMWTSWVGCRVGFICWSFYTVSYCIRMIGVRISKSIFFQGRRNITTAWINTLSVMHQHTSLTILILFCKDEVIMVSFNSKVEYINAAYWESSSETSVQSHFCIPKTS